MASGPHYSKAWAHTKYSTLRRTLAIIPPQACPLPSIDLTQPANLMVVGFDALRLVNADGSVQDPPIPTGDDVPWDGSLFLDRPNRNDFWYTGQFGVPPTIASFGPMNGNTPALACQVFSDADAAELGIGVGAAYWILAFGNNVNGPIWSGARRVDFTVKGAYKAFPNGNVLVSQTTFHPNQLTLE